MLTKMGHAVSLLANLLPVAVYNSFHQERHRVPKMSEPMKGQERSGLPPLPAGVGITRSAGVDVEGVVDGVSRAV